MAVSEVVSQFMGLGEVDPTLRRVSGVVEDGPLPALAGNERAFEFAGKIPAFDVNDGLGRIDVAGVVLRNFGDPDRETRLTEQLLALTDVERHAGRPAFPRRRHLHFFRLQVWIMSMTRPLVSSSSLLNFRKNPSLTWGSSKPALSSTR